MEGSLKLDLVQACVSYLGRLALAKDNSFFIQENENNENNN